MAADIKDRESAKSAIYKIITNTCDVAEDKLQEESHFVDDLGLDSLDVVEVIMAFEDEFDIEIPDDDMKKITLVSDALNYIAKRLEIEDVAGSATASMDKEIKELDLSKITGKTSGGETQE